jgi:hypothetical protein
MKSFLNLIYDVYIIPIKLIVILVNIKLILKLIFEKCIQIIYFGDENNGIKINLVGPHVLLAHVINIFSWALIILLIY